MLSYLANRSDQNDAEAPTGWNGQLRFTLRPKQKFALLYFTLLYFALLYFAHLGSILAYCHSKPVFDSAQSYGHTPGRYSVPVNWYGKRPGEHCTVPIVHGIMSLLYFTLLYFTLLYFGLFCFGHKVIGLAGEPFTLTYSYLLMSFPTHLAGLVTFFFFFFWQGSWVTVF